MSVTVEVFGLEIFGHHGATAEEQEAGQTYLYDLWLDVADPAEDRLEDTVDYEEVSAAVREVSNAHRFHLLEALAAAVADTIVMRFDVERVAVRVRKRGVEPAGLPVEYTAALVVRDGG